MTRLRKAATPARSQAAPYGRPTLVPAPLNPPNPFPLTPLPSLVLLVA